MQELGGNAGVIVDRSADIDGAVKDPATDVGPMVDEANALRTHLTRNSNVLSMCAWC